MSELRERVQAAADAFCDPIDHSFWEEYGISRKDAERGAIAMLLHWGAISAAQERELLQEIKDEEAAQDAERERYRLERRAAMTPGQRKMEDEINEAMRLNMERLNASVIDTIFKPNALFRTWATGPQEKTP